MSGGPVERVKLDFLSGVPLAEQFAEALRSAIRAGEFRVGEVLPTVKEWCAALGCSAFVPRRAMGVLAKEGVLSVKRHVGAMVTGRLAPERKKLVVYVTRDDGGIWSRSVFACRLGEILWKAGYRFEHVRICRKSNDALSSEHLQDAIRRGIDFVVCEISRPQFTETFRKAGIPFAVVSVGNEELPGAEAIFKRVDDELVGNIVGLLKRLGCQRVAMYGAGAWLNDRMSAQLYKAGIHLQRRVVAPFPSYPATAEQWQRAAMEAFDAQLSGGGGLPDALVFYDDYVAAGALMALARHGVKVPEDVKILTFSNKGLGPVFFKPLTRFESDHAANAEKIGRWLKARLAGKRVAPPRIAASLIRGATM